VSSSAEDLDLALLFVDDHRIGFWDAYLRATATRVGIDYLLT